MAQLKLVRPDRSHEQQINELYAEFLAAGETAIPGGGNELGNFASYTEWLETMEKQQHEGTVAPGLVPATRFFGVRESDGKIVGLIVVRHYLNDVLRQYGGHIGYSIRPSERRKGYAGEMLRLVFDFCRELGLDQIMISCKSENEASRRTILGAGGKLEREFMHPDGYLAQCYWIKLP